MPKHEYSLSSLEHLDMGKLNEAFALELKRAVADCRDRPGENSPRRVTMEVLIRPDPDVSNVCDDVTVETKFKLSLPAQRTRAYRMAVQHNNSLKFHSDFPDEPNSVGLLDHIEEGEE